MKNLALKMIDSFIHSFAKTNDKELCKRDPLKWHERISNQSSGVVHQPLCSILDRCIYIQWIRVLPAANLIHFFNCLDMLTNYTLV